MRTKIRIFNHIQNEVPAKSIINFIHINFKVYRPSFHPPSLSNFWIIRNQSPFNKTMAGNKNNVAVSTGYTGMSLEILTEC